MMSAACFGVAVFCFGIGLNCLKSDMPGASGLMFLFAGLNVFNGIANL